jgi:hypothetical protein
MRFLQHEDGRVRRVAIGRALEKPVKTIQYERLCRKNFIRAIPATGVVRAS